MFYNEEEYFILKFRSTEDRDLVLMKGPYTIQNMPMLIRIWDQDFCLKRDLLRTVPVWVKLPQLPLHLWGPRSLSKIGSVIGKPFFTDECTANKLRVSYARILVEIDITQKLADTVTIKGIDGHKMNQPIEYEWKPTYCESFQKMGHDCKIRDKPDGYKKWIEKPEQKKLEQVIMKGTGKEYKDIEKWTTVERKKRATDKGKR